MNLNSKRCSCITYYIVTAAVALALNLPVPAVSADEVPPRTDSGIALVVPAEHAALGTVYHIRYPAHSGQVTFVSDAPIERIVGVSNKVVGYVVVDTESGQLRAGAFRLPVRSFESGIALRDQHMMQPNFFDADRFPEMTFRITRSSDARLTNSENDVRSFEMTMIGQLTVRDQTHELTIPTRVELMPASAKTRNAGPGDVMGLRCSYTIKRSEFGVAPGMIGQEVSDLIHLDQAFILTTISHDSALSSEAEVMEFRLGVLLDDLRDAEAARAHAVSMIDRFGEDAAVLNSIVSRIANAKIDDLLWEQFTLDAATHAADLTEYRDASVLETLALAHFKRGELRQAVDTLRLAAKHLDTAQQSDVLVQRLHEYERLAGLPPTQVAGFSAKDLPHPAEYLTSCIGAYEVTQPPLSLRIVAVENKLAIEAGGQSAIPLLYQGEGSFRISIQPSVEIRFSIENERAGSLTIFQNGREMIGKRVGD